jgi:hypothetical protein
MRMNLTTDKDGNLYYNDIIFNFAKKAYQK